MYTVAAWGSAFIRPNTKVLEQHDGLTFDESEEVTQDILNRYDHVHVVKFNMESGTPVVSGSITR